MTKQLLYKNSGNQVKIGDVLRDSTPWCGSKEYMILKLQINDDESLIITTCNPDNEKEIYAKDILVYARELGAYFFEDDSNQQLKEGLMQKGVNDAPITPRPSGDVGGQGSYRWQSPPSICGWREKSKEDRVIQMLSHDKLLYILMESGKMYRYIESWDTLNHWDEVELPK